MGILCLIVYEQSGKVFSDGLSHFLSEDSNNCKLLNSSLYKSKRVTRSVFGCEAMTFADSFDIKCTVKYNLQHII